MSDIKEMLEELKDRIFPRKLGYVKIPISEAEKEQYGNFQAYMPLKYAEKFGLENCRELDTLDYADGAIRVHKREKPKFDGIILDSAHNYLRDAEKAMEYMAKKYDLPVSAFLNSRFCVKNPHLQISQTRER